MVACSRRIRGDGIRPRRSRGQRRGRLTTGARCRPRGGSATRGPSFGSCRSGRSSSRRPRPPGPVHDGSSTRTAQSIWPREGLTAKGRSSPTARRSRAWRPPRGSGGDPPTRGCRPVPAAGSTMGGRDPSLGAFPYAGADGRDGASATRQSRRRHGAMVAGPTVRGPRLRPGRHAGAWPPDPTLPRPGHRLSRPSPPRPTGWRRGARPRRL